MHSGRTTGFQFGYDPSGNLTNLLDGNNSRTAWGYDQFGRVTSKLDSGNSEILRFN